MKKKILTLLAFLVLVTGMMISPAAVERVWAETTISKDGKWRYGEDGNGGIIIESYNGKETELTDWGTIDDKTVTGIGGHAFYDCSSLNSISIPNSVTSIGVGAFKGCSSLTSISIPNSVTIIWDETFRNCSSLSNISIPNSVTNINEYAFAGCSSLSSISIPNSVTYIGYFAFGSCRSLNSITIPNSVIDIGEFAFAGCSSLSSINIPNGVIFIGEGAFRNCGSLTSITIPSSVTRIGTEIFGGCEKLEKVTVDGNNPNYESDDIGIYNKGKTTLVCCLPSKKDVNIPFGVTSIGECAFCDCPYLTSINIPSSVTRIGRAAFSASNNIQDIYYGGSKEQWEQAAWNYDKDDYDSVNNYYGIGDSVTIHYNFTTPETPVTPQNPTQTITAKNITKTYGAKAFSLNAKVDTGAKLTYSVSDKKVATVDKKGKVTIKGCGITNIIITAAATGNYGKETKTIILTVKPKKATLSSVKSTKKKTAAVNWKQNKEAAGYIIQCATDSKFTKNKVQKTISKNKTVSATVKKLKAGKKYYVRVCAYAKSGKTKVQGNWSKVKTVRVKK